MSVNWVDVVVVLGVLLVGLAGWRAGLISTAAAFAGFFGGALFGAWLVPRLLADRELPTLVAAAATLGGMLVLGLIGQAVLGAVGHALRDAVDVTPVRLVDQASGMVVSAVAFLLSAWLVLSVVAQLPAGGAADEVRASRSYPLLEQVMAGPGGALMDDARALLSNLDLPSLPFDPATVPPVADPADVEVTEAVRRIARVAVLRVAATSSRCATSTLGSSVVVAPQRVVTNAHVVTGAGRITVQGADGRRRDATLVYLDPDADLAVLYVPGLDARAPAWVADPKRGTKAAVVGYPGGGRLTVRGARVRGVASLATQSGGGLREVVVIQGLVQPGNSGGPLLDLDGHVLGLVFANSSLDDRTGFALTPDEVEPAVDASRTSTEPVDSGACATVG